MRLLLKRFSIFLLFFLVLETVFWVLWGLNVFAEHWEIATAINSLVLGLLSILFFIIFVWIQNQKKNLPPTEIDLNFVSKIVNAQQDILISFNKAYEITWTNKPNELQKALSFKKKKQIYGYPLKKIIKIPQLTDFQKNKLKESEIFFEKSQHFFLGSNVGKYLLLLKSNQLISNLKKFIGDEHPVFLLLELDENFSPNAEEIKLEKYRKTLDAFVSLEINDFFQKIHGISFELAENEHAIIMPYSTLKNLIEENFAFTKALTKKAKQKYNFNIAFSGGVFLPQLKKLNFKNNNAIKKFDMLFFFNKSLQAKKIAQSRGGDQIIALNKDGNFKTYGQQRETLKLPSNTKQKYTELIDKLSNYKSIVITGHRHPDLDTIGAGIGLKNWIQRKFPKKSVFFTANSISPDTKTKVLNFMEGNSKIFKEITEKFDFMHWSKTKNKKLIIFVDTNNPNFVDFPPEEINKIDQAVFDHHVPQFQLEKVVFEYSNLQFSSASEIVLNLLRYEELVIKDFQIPTFILQIILSGILLDTNNLQMNMTQQTLEAINFIGKHMVIQKFIDLFKQFKITALTKKKDTKSADVTFIFEKIALIKKIDSNSSQTNSAIVAENYLETNLVKCAISVMSSGLKNQDIFVSVRSRDQNINAAAICEALGGGGDNQRAAAQLKSSEKKYDLEKAIETIKKHLKKIIAHNIT